MSTFARRRSRHSRRLINMTAWPPSIRSARHQPSGHVQASPHAPVIEKHHLKGVLSGFEFPMVAHRPGWVCQITRCEYIERASQCLRAEVREAAGGGGYFSVGTAGPGGVCAAITSNAIRDAGDAGQK